MVMGKKVIDKNFMALATIDYAYWSIQEMCKVLLAPNSPIDRAIDDATGKGIADVKEIRKNSIRALRDVINAKNVLSYDCSNDEKILKALTK